MVTCRSMSWVSVLIFMILQLYGCNGNSKVIEVPVGESRHLYDVEPGTTFVVRNQTVSVGKLFSNVFFKLSSFKNDTSSFRVYGGSSLDDAIVPSTNLLMNPFRGKTSNMYTRSLSPFEDFYFSVEAGVFGHKVNATITVSLVHVSAANVCFLISGILLFFLAPALSRSVAFHYTSGISLGMVLAWLILIVLLLKLLPYKKFISAALLTSSSAALYSMEILLTKGLVLVQNYPAYCVGYCIVCMLLTSALMYYFGPVSSEKGLNLIQWGLQLAALFLIYICSYHKQFSVTAVVITVTMYLISRFVSFYQLFIQITLRAIPRKYYYHYFAPKRRLLTMEEYDEQGREETATALDSLRSYCSSPECKSWEVVSRMKNPKRFAEFMQNGVQFTRQELDDYDQFEIQEEDDRHEWFSDDESMAIENSDEITLINNSLMSDC